MKVRDIIDIGVPEIRKFYEKYYKKKVKDRITPATFLKILETYNQRVVDDILFEGKIYYTPYNQGTMYISKRKPKVEFDENYKLIRTTAAIDFKAQNELWASNPEAKAAKVKVYHQNDHSDGYRYSITWSRGRTATPGLSTYRFVPARSVKRALAQKIKNGGVEC